MSQPSQHADAMSKNTCPVCDKPIYPHLGDVPAARAGEYCERECKGHALGRYVVVMESALQASRALISQLRTVLAKF